MTFDPDFENNNWVYVVYTPGDTVPCPATEAANATCGEVSLSRFTMDFDTMDLDSEQVLLRWPHQRNVCCHTSGDLAFDNDGNLFVGGISFNRVKPSNGDVYVATYDSEPHPSGYPVDYVRTVVVGKGTPSEVIGGIFQDKPMLEVDRTGGAHDGNVYVCDVSTSRIQKFTSTGAFLTEWGENGSGNGQARSGTEASQGASGQSTDG